LFLVSKNLFLISKKYLMDIYWGVIRVFLGIASATKDTLSPKETSTTEKRKPQQDVQVDEYMHVKSQ
jgi:hypothetical protein